MTPQRTAADQAILEQLSRFENAVTRYTSAVNELVGLTLNDVLLDELVTIPAEGWVTRSCSAAAAYVAAWAYGGDITLTSDPAQGPIAPEVGTGVKRIPGGLAIGWAFAGNNVTIYGTPGDEVLIALWSKPMPPFVAAAGDVIGGTP